ncbi:MAG TPA: hypothetical protein VLY24_19225 [Bryobacteraceae bacterium]|nr:hypothetical protein [Bryobacteraceae bacterium]
MARKLLNVGILVAFTAALSAVYAQPGGVRLLGTQAGRPGKVVKGAPYSADVTNETTRTLADGNTIRQVSSGRVYRDSEGRTRQEPALQALGSGALGAKVPQLAFIYDPVASVSYALNLRNRTATRTVWPAPAARSANLPNALPRREQANARRESLGTQVLAGLVAEVTRNTLTIPAGQIGNAQPLSVVTERWYSPDLQVVLYSKRTDPREGETVFQLTNINRSEPPAGLFTVPADFPMSDVAAGPRRRP